MITGEMGEFLWRLKVSAELMHACSARVQCNNLLLKAPCTAAAVVVTRYN